MEVQVNCSSPIAARILKAVEEGTIQILQDRNNRVIVVTPYSVTRDEKRGMLTIRAVFALELLGN